VRYSLAEATSKENSSQELSTGSTPTTVGLRPSLLKRGLSGLSRVLTTIRMLLCKKNIPKHENEGGKLTHLQGIGRSLCISGMSHGQTLTTAVIERRVEKEVHNPSPFLSLFHYFLFVWQLR
jgi:hypothetical protein